MFHSSEITQLLTALQLAAEKHRHQRRKDNQASPYINHPIQVAEILWHIGGVREIAVIAGALLHDTLEDTDLTPQEIEANCGAEILALVQAVTDDKSLPKQQRKQLQIEHAPHQSPGAKLIKLADKICNIYDIIHSPPQTWSQQRCQAYIDWSQQVVAGLRGINPALETYYDQLIAQANQKFEKSNRD